MTRHRLAVIEDNPDNRLLLRALLSDLYDIEEYEDGPSALVGILATPPALALLDISLPGMDGSEVLRRIRGTPGIDTLPVIALTAHAMSGDRERFLGEGFNGYVTKPIVDEELLFTSIRELLASK